MGKSSPEASRRWREAHPEQWKAISVRWAKANPEKLRARTRKSVLQRKGLTLEAYDLFYTAQGGLCAVCRQPETARDRNGRVKKLAVDHNHKTGKIRGLLCQRCNHGIGQMQDNPVLLRAAADYLERTYANCADRGDDVGSDANGVQTDADLG